MLFKLVLYSYVLCFLSLQKKDVPPPATHSGFMSQDVAQEVVNMMSVWKPSHKQNIWELSGQYEGDIMINKNETELKNVLVNEDKRWRNGILPYFIDKAFDEYEITTIKKALKEIQKNTCIILRPYKNDDKDYVFVKNNSPGCWSYTGRQGGGQVLNLSPKCVRHGVVIHEFLHALGLYHQQSASNRDDYIVINWENIREESKNNFKKYDPSHVTDFNISYDYSSIMHYGRYAFSKNEEPTITPIEKEAKIGQRKHLSEQDIQKVNIMYKCKCNTTNSTNTTNKDGDDSDDEEDYTDELYDIVSDVINK